MDSVRGDHMDMAEFLLHQFKVSFYTIIGRLVPEYIIIQVSNETITYTDHWLQYMCLHYLY